MFLNRYPVKVALISALSYSIGDFLSLSYPKYMIFGILVSVTPTIAQSLQESFKRVFGIVAGGFIAVIMISNWQSSPVSLAIGLCLSVLFCYAIKTPQIAGQAATTFCLLSASHLSDLDQYYQERFFDNTLGVMIGTMANILLPPPISAVKLKQGMKQILMQIGDLYQTLALSYLNPNLESNAQKNSQLEAKINKTLAQNSKLLQATQLELSQGFGDSEESQKLDQIYRLIQALIVMVKDLNGVIENSDQDQVSNLLLPELSYLVQVSHQTFYDLADISEIQANSPLMVSTQEGKILLPNLSEALAHLNAKVEDLNIVEKAHQYDLEQVIRLSSFLDDLREIARELINLSKAIDET